MSAIKQQQQQQQQLSANNHSSSFIDRGNLVQQKLQHDFLDRHKKRLDEIAHRGNNRRSPVAIVPIGGPVFQSDNIIKINENKKVIHEILMHQKQDMIEKSNSILLRKLVEIQSGKRSLLSTSNSSAALIENRSKSLHFGARKLEKERIERENLKIAQKIFDLKPRFRVSEMEQEYQKHRQYSDVIRKKIVRRKTQPKHGGRLGQLPPLSSTMPDNVDPILGFKPSAIDSNTLHQKAESPLDVTKSLEVHSTRELLNKPQQPQAMITLDSSRNVESVVQNGKTSGRSPNHNSGSKDLSPYMAKKSHSSKKKGNSISPVKVASEKIGDSPKQ